MGKENVISRRSFIGATAAVVGGSMVNGRASQAQAAAPADAPTAPDITTTTDFAERWRDRYYEGEALRIGQRVQMLMDDAIVEGRVGLTRIIGPVEKSDTGPLNPGPPLPFEKHMRVYYKVEDAEEAHPDLPSPSFDVVIRNFDMQLRYYVYDPWEKLYKGYYSVRHYTRGRIRPGDTSYNRCTYYAESKDGLNWTKPALDFFPINGMKTNVVLRNPNGGTFQMNDVRVDPDATDPNRRFIATAKTVPPGEQVRCIVLLYSPDGRKWDFAPDPILVRGASDGSYNPVEDPDRGRWLLYRRPPTTTMPRRGPGVYHEANNKRELSVSISRDYQNWTHPRIITVLHEIDDGDENIHALGLHKGTMLGNTHGIDGISVMRHEASGMFLGFLTLMANRAMTPTTCHLMWSRDGLRWEMLPYRPMFVPNGASGEWDAGRVGGMNVLADGDDPNLVRLYYHADNLPQHEARAPRHGGSGLAYIGRDRFVGLQAGLSGGFMLTRQFILEGNRLEINCRSNVRHPAPGLAAEIRAEILEEPVEHMYTPSRAGFTMEDCDPIAVSDEYNRLVTWKGSPDLSSLRGQKVYIRFYIQNATLYTFRVFDA